MDLDERVKVLEARVKTLERKPEICTHKWRYRDCLAFSKMSTYKCRLCKLRRDTWSRDLLPRYGI